MNRIVLNAAEKFDVRVNTIDGGGLRNAIPISERSFADVTVPADKADAFTALIKKEEAILQNNINMHLQFKHQH